MLEGLEIRGAELKDLRGILEIKNDVIEGSTSDYRYEKIGGIKELEGWYKGHINAGEPILVGVLGEEVLGYGTYSKFREREGFKYSIEHSIYCKSGYSGRGIGRMLMMRLMEEARGVGMHTMIGCIDSNNKGSIKFHEREGFKRVGEIKEVGYKFGVYLDMTLMQKIL